MLKRTLQQPNAFHLVLPERALHETPRVVELRLYGHMRLRELLLVLDAENLERAKAYGLANHAR